MKKFLFLIFFMVSAIFVFSQNTGITSILGDVSEGVFTNELDAAVSVDGMLSSGPDFRSLQHDYLFAGLTNIEKTQLQNTYSHPFWAGFYKAGPKPWSFFGTFEAKSTGGNQTGGTTYTQGPAVTVHSGSNGTLYQWNNSASTTKYTANRLFDTMDMAGQYLFTLGGINTGVFASMALDKDSDIQANNFEQTVIHYYNAAAANTKPDPKEDYTHTITKTERDSDVSEFVLAVPLFIPDGDSSQMLNFGITFTALDNSKTRAEDYTGKPQAIPAWSGFSTYVTDDEKRVLFTGTLNAAFKLKKKGVWGKNPKDRLFFTGSCGLVVGGLQYEKEQAQKTFTALGGGAAITSAYNSYVHDYEYKGTPSFDISLNGGAGHSFYFDLGSGVELGFSPDASIGYELVLPQYIKTATQVAKTDGNSDGDYKDAADFVDTKVSTYSNTSIDSNGNFIDAAIKNKITTEITMPMSVSFTPPKWPITIVLGSKPSVSATMTFTGTKTSTVKSVTTRVDGTGTSIPGTYTTNAATTDETSTFSTTYSMSATHNIGFSMPINDAVRIDVSLDASTGTSIFEFRKLTAQTIIALP